MIPFDPYALLAMLLAFYPIVSRANLERARRERPDYFAGGVLFGSQGEKLLLGDGRAFDLCFDAWGPQRRWQVIDVTNAAPDAPDPFGLEPGPFVPLDEDATIPPTAPPIFEELAAGALAEFGAADDLLGDRESDLAEKTGEEMVAAYEADVAPAIEDLDEQIESLAALDPAEGIEAAGGLNDTIDSEAGVVPNPEDEPPDIPEEDPGPPRDDTGPRDPPPPKDEQDGPR